MIKWALMVGMASSMQTAALIDEKPDCESAASVITRKAAEAAQGGRHIQAKCEEVEMLKINPDGTIELDTQK